MVATKGMLRWAEDEDGILRLFWLSKTHAEIAEMLPGRNLRAVRNRCWKLRLVEPRHWSEFEENAIIQWYADHENKRLMLDELAKVLGRSRYAVCIKARKMGLTDIARERGGRKKRDRKYPDEIAWRKAMSEAAKARIAKNGHPRGMLGKKKTPEAIAKTVAGLANWRALQSSATMSEIALRSANTRIAKYGTAFPINSGNPYSRARRGRRNDLGDIFFRSRWEANYARFLNLLKDQGKITAWEFEPDTFWFEAIKRGIRSYTPDFKIWEPSGSFYYVEVKGWNDAKSKTKAKRMKKYHPDVEVRLFGAKAYKELERKLGAAIPGWEPS